MQAVEVQLALTGPAEPGILQCPSTASSGRKLTRMILGGSYVFRLSGTFWFSSFIINGFLSSVSSTRSAAAREAGTAAAAFF
jgi:hypothetical protein